MGRNPLPVTTIEKFELCLSTVKNYQPPGPGRELTQRELAKLTGFSPSTITRLVSHPPFNTAFSRNAWGGLTATGRQPDYAAYKRGFDLDTSDLPELEQALTEKLPRLRLKDGFEAGNPIPKLIAAVEANQAKSESGLSEKQLAKLIDQAELFAVELLRLVLKTKAQPHYAQPNWWIDYVQETT